MKKNFGSCHCGKVKYEILGELKFIAHDHCGICRKISGGTFTTWCGVNSEKEQFRVISGESELSTYHSSANGSRQFCKNCGSHLFFRSPKWKGEVHFTRASIDEDLKTKPSAHVYFSDRANWYDESDNLPKFGGESGVEPL